MPMVLRRRFLSVLLAALLAAAAPVRAAEWLLSFEALSGENESTLYAERAARTVRIVSEVGPAVLTALGLDPGAFDVEIGPGGYQAKTNPSVLLRLDGDAAAADRVAAALGYVFRQSSVLVWGDAAGDDALVVAVAFPAVTPNLADFFFRHAAAVHAGLAGGYTARGNALLFINLRGADGQPYSGLADDAFAAELARAADSFGGIASVATAKVAARLVESDAYAARIGGDAMPALDRLRARHAALSGRR